MTSLLPPARLRESTSSDKPVTWLELFFDLIFVAAIAQVAEPLRHDYTVAGLVRFSVLFALLWWAWMGYAVFATRFSGSGRVQRVLTLLQMFGVAAMGANASGALDSRDSAGFAAAYALLRIILVLQYAHASTIACARRLATCYAAGHGLAAALWLASAFVPAPTRFVLWALALAVDLGTPWVTVRHNVALPPHAAHLAERFGLFTLILLGESVVAVIHGMKSREVWTAVPALSAFLGIAAAFVIWWWYFERLNATAECPVRSTGDAIRLHVRTYAHLPLYIGIALAAAGVERLVQGGDHHGGHDTWLLGMALLAIGAGLGGIVIANPTRVRLRRRSQGSDDVAQRVRRRSTDRSAASHGAA